jgi:hypothetical protein
MDGGINRPLCAVQTALKHWCIKFKHQGSQQKPHTNLILPNNMNTTSF